MSIEEARKEDLIPWSLLSYEGRSLLKSIQSNWRLLLADPRATESDLHQFIAEHASLFFGQEAAVISRFDLGSDYQIDLVIPTDEASYGVSYNLVEIETPRTAPYTRSRNASARLTHAIQQVLIWKTWLKRHRRGQRIGQLLLLGEKWEDDTADFVEGQGVCQRLERNFEKIWNRPENVVIQ